MRRAMAPRSPGFIPELLWKPVEKNFRRLMQEIRQTGELSVLLTRVARGQALTAEERKRMRAQLIDVAKAIPALAIFAAPGGLLLLILLAKVLPFSLLPSAFQEQEEETGAGEAKDAASSAAVVTPSLLVIASRARQREVRGIVAAAVTTRKDVLDGGPADWLAVEADLKMSVAVDAAAHPHLAFADDGPLE